MPRHRPPIPPLSVAVLLAAAILVAWVAVECGRGTIGYVTPVAP